MTAPTAAAVLRALADALTRPLEDGEPRLDAVMCALEDVTGAMDNDEIAAVLLEVAGAKPDVPGDAEHLRLIDAVNDARTRDEHDAAEAALRGWRKRNSYDWMLCDFHTCARYGVDLSAIDPSDDGACPPVCVGVRLDWSPDGYARFANVLEVADGTE